MNPVEATRSVFKMKHMLIVVLAVALAFGLCGALYFREARAIESGQREREAMRVGMYTRYFRMELQPVVNDLRTLASGDGLAAWLVTGAEADLARAAHRAAFYSEMHPAYDQVRFLDDRGRERLRVNRGGQVVPAAQLQDKSGRSYFQRAWALPPGQLAVSAFDLNVENGQIEEPLKPMLRFSMPVFDAGGTRRGVYVINYLGAELLARLQEAVPAYGHRLRMLNPGGYWLKGRTPAEEWGFLLPGREDVTLARTDPALWDRIRREPAGQAARAGGLFTWARIAPETLGGESPGVAITGNEFLIIASEVSADEWAALFAGIRQIFYVVTPVLLFLAGGGTWLLLARRRAVQALGQSEQSLAITLHSIGDAVLATDPRRPDHALESRGRTADRLDAGRCARPVGRGGVQHRARGDARPGADPGGHGAGHRRDPGPREPYGLDRA